MNRHFGWLWLLFSLPYKETTQNLAAYTSEKSATEAARSSLPLPSSKEDRKPVRGTNLPTFFATPIDPDLRGHEQQTLKMHDKSIISKLQPSIAFDAGGSQSEQTANTQLKGSTSYHQHSISSKVPAITIRTPDMHRVRQVTSINSLLMSPPEIERHDSFARGSPKQTKKDYACAIYNLPSPPVSPNTPSISPEVNRTPSVADPILYSIPDTSSVTSSQPPLFEEEVTYADQRVVNEHIAARAEKTQFGVASPPAREEYLLALAFKSQVMRKYNANRRLWMVREKNRLREDQAHRRNQQSFTNNHRPIAMAPARSPLGTRGVKNSSANVTKTPPKVKPIKTAAPRDGTPPPKNPNREDKDFHLLPDYSPPLSTLPNKQNSLKVEWKGAPVNHDSDPFRHLLHDDEALLAGYLRLDCATYLTSKRRIFIGLLSALQKGKDFKKTHAQMATRVDVNKASKLWTAFEKVGWFHSKHFQKYMHIPQL